MAQRRKAWHGLPELMGCAGPGALVFVVVGGLLCVWDAVLFVLVMSLVVAVAKVKTAHLADPLLKHEQTRVIFYTRTTVSVCYHWQGDCNAAWLHLVLEKPSSYPFPTACGWRLVLCCPGGFV